MWAQIGTLIMATSLIQLANGFFGTFISLRVATEDFGATMSGLVLSSYFAGFTLGALRCERIIERVGHIRAYAAFVGLVVAATALMPLRVGPLPWLTLRAAVGFGCAGLFVATESWLNAKAEPAQRGRVFSGYMFGTFLALALGQLLIGWAKIETAGPFNAIVALFAAALIMVSTTRAEPPRGAASAALPFWSTLPCGARRRGRLPDGRARERRLLRSRSSLDARRRHRTRHDCDIHARGGAGRARIPSSGGPTLRSLRPTDCARRTQPWLCRRRHRVGQFAAFPVSCLLRRSVARRFHVDAIPGLCR